MHYDFQMFPIFKRFKPSMLHVVLCKAHSTLMNKQKSNNFKIFNYIFQNRALSFETHNIDFQISLKLDYLCHFKIRTKL